MPGDSAEDSGVLSGRCPAAAERRPEKRIGGDEMVAGACAALTWRTGGGDRGSWEVEPKLSENTESWVAGGDEVEWKLSENRESWVAGGEEEGPA